ncbi:lipopolysaccharide biosynthesis protein [Psychrosphaera aestuarii]|uniref:lipopolysaccharide biosynthesis protein n=1 Tax=Psychrosphaera aestuarii TaxID=1266052 RepID=UPI001B31D86B|nr:hypothetical protein [Psychrosphaera aestuarii]
MVKDSFLNIFDRGLKALFSLVFLVLLSRYATVEVFGSIMILLIYRQISLVVFTIGSDNYFLQQILENKSVSSKVKCFLNHFYLRFLLASIVIICSIGVFDESISLMVFSGSMLALSSLIESYNRANNLIFVNIVSYFLILICISVFYLDFVINESISFSDAIQIVVFESVLGLFVLLLSFIIKYAKYLKGLLFCFNLKFFQPSILASLCLSAIVAILQSRIDIILLEVFGSLNDVAELGLVSRLASLLFIPIVAFNTVLIVRAKTAKENEIDGHLFRQLNQLTFLFVYLTMMLTSIILSFSFVFIFGDKYEGALTIFYIYMFTLIPSSALQLHSVWYYQEGLITFALIKNLITIIFSGVLLFLFIPVYGVFGASLIMVFAGFLNAFLLNVFNKKAFKLLTHSYKGLFFYDIKFLIKGK